MLSGIEVRVGLSNSVSSSGGESDFTLYYFLDRMVRRRLTSPYERLGVVTGLGLHALLTALKTMDVSMQSFVVLLSFSP
jgi:hypothetical protein